jgi:hypothetical protein
MTTYQDLYYAIEQQGGTTPCQNYPDAFFAPEMDDPNYTGETTIDNHKIARKLCSTCPVKKVCLDYSTTTMQTWGIWAGTSYDERLALTKRQKPVL